MFVQRVFVLLLAIVCSAWAITERDFNIRPGFTEKVEVVLDGNVCSFSYKCSGGTNEGWKISIDVDNGAYICFIGRPSPPSYLFFTEFAAEMTMLNQESVDVQVFDNSGAVLRDDQYEVKGGKVTQAPGFGGSLALIQFTSK